MNHQILWKVPFNFGSTRAKDLVDKEYDSCDLVAGIQGDFASQVRQILSDERGWSQFGIEFIEQPDNPRALKIQLRALKPSNEGHLSFYYPKHHAIFINYYCWMTGGKFFPNNKYKDLRQLVDAIIYKKFKPNPLLDDYRFYVITHETGHALGLEHPEKENVKPGTPGRVMMQMTKGADYIRPYALNTRPLPSDNPKDPKNYMSLYRR